MRLKLIWWWTLASRLGVVTARSLCDDARRCLERNDTACAGPSLRSPAAKARARLAFRAYDDASTVLFVHMSKTSGTSMLQGFLGGVAARAAAAGKRLRVAHEEPTPLNLDVLCAAASSTIFVTVLREPVARLVSAFNYEGPGRDKPDHTFDAARWHRWLDLYPKNYYTVRLVDRVKRPVSRPDACAYDWCEVGDFRQGERWRRAAPNQDEPGDARHACAQRRRRGFRFRHMECCDRFQDGASPRGAAGDGYFCLTSADWTWGPDGTAVGANLKGQGRAAFVERPLATAVDLAVAKRVLASFDFVGITERMDTPETAARLKQLFGYDVPYGFFPRARRGQASRETFNRTENKRRAALRWAERLAGLPPDVRERIEREHDVDVRLYAWAAKRDDREGRRGG